MSILKYVLLLRIVKLFKLLFIFKFRCLLYFFQFSVPNKYPIKVVYFVLENPAHHAPEVHVGILRLFTFLCQILNPLKTLKPNLDMHWPLHQVQLIIAANAAFPSSAHFLRLLYYFRVDEGVKLLVLLRCVPVLVLADQEQPLENSHLWSSDGHPFFLEKTVNRSDCVFALVYAIKDFRRKRKGDFLALTSQHFISFS